MIAAAKKDQCKTPGCTRQAYSRGVCNPCFCMARKLVDSGNTTFDELERLGLVEAKRNSASAFRLAFEKAKAATKGSRKATARSK